MKKRYNDGGLPDYEREPDEQDRKQQEGAMAEYTDRKEKEAIYAKPLEKASFKEAFAEARADGKKTFEYMGKQYSTNLAKDKPAKSSKEDKEDPEMVRKAYQDAARLRKPKETPESQYQRVKNEPGLETVSPELDVLPVGKIAGAAGAVGAALKGMSVLGKRYAAKEVAEKAGEETAKRAAKIAAGKEAAKKSRAKSSGAMEGEAGAGELRYKKGGSVASRRGDGIAMRGKTRGKIC